MHPNHILRLDTLYPLLNTHTHTYRLLHIHPGASNWEMTEQKPTICMEEEGLPLSFSTQQEISQKKEVILPCWECLWPRIVFVKSSRCASFTASLSSPGYCAPEAWWCGLKRGGWRRERKGEGEWVRKGEGEWVSECVCEREREKGNAKNQKLQGKDGETWNHRWPSDNYFSLSSLSPPLINLRVNPFLVHKNSYFFPPIRIR